MTAPAVEARAVAKHYGGVRALEAVSLAVHEGEVLALVGDNGAGKTTLVKLLSGAERPSAGEIAVGGRSVQFHSGRDARVYGIETVYQNLALAENLPVWANMFLGRELYGRGLARRLRWLDRRAMRATAREQLANLHVTIPDVDSRVKFLSGGQRQAVAVARAVAWGRRIVIMDEPTAALGPEQQEQVLNLIRRVRDGGTPVLLVSHSLQQVMEVADRVAVLRRGQLVTVVPANETTPDELVAYITGLRGATARP